MYYDPNTTVTFSLRLTKVTDTTQAVSLTGATQNGPLSVPGQIGTALDFTGTEYASVPNSTAIAQNNTVTLQLWIDPDRYVNTYGALLFKGDNIAFNDNSRTYALYPEQ